MLNKEKAGKKRKREGEKERETETLMRATPPLSPPSNSINILASKIESNQKRKKEKKQVLFIIPKKHAKFAACGAKNSEQK